MIKNLLHCIIVEKSNSISNYLLKRSFLLANMFHGSFVTEQFSGSIELLSYYIWCLFQNKSCKFAKQEQTIFAEASTRSYAHMALSLGVSVRFTSSEIVSLIQIFKTKTIILNASKANNIETSKLFVSKNCNKVSPLRVLYNQKQVVSKKIVSRSNYIFKSVKDS